MAYIKDFDTFLSQLQETNLTLDTICDFNKVIRNVDDVRLDLCILNSLIGARSLRQSVETIWRRSPEAFSALEILVAIRAKDKKKVLTKDGECVRACSYLNSVDGVMTFIRETGLAEIFKHGEISGLTDYVFGVEVGMDSNGRKNRSGDVMEMTVARKLRNADIDFRHEVSSKEWPRIQKALGNDEKRFDFAIETPRKTFLIEVNFYSSSGSKLNEVSRAYTELAPKINSITGFEFVWITDGKGWNSAKNKLEEAYLSIPSVYNLTTIDLLISKIKRA